MHTIYAIYTLYILCICYIHIGHVIYVCNTYAMERERVVLHSTYTYYAQNNK